MREGLTTLEQKDGDLAEVEVDEVASLVRHIGAEVTTHDAMPRWVVFLIKFLLDECSNILKLTKTINYGNCLTTDHNRK